MRKEMFVRRIFSIPDGADAVPALLDAAGVSFERMECVGWPDKFPYKPEVRFRMALAEGCLLLHYEVSEQCTRAVAGRDNGNVWEDSCCEFFVQSETGGIYYNFECNAAGVLLIGAGENRQGRELAPPEALRSVQRWSTWGGQPFEEVKGQQEWQLALIIPMAQAFFKHRAGEFSPSSGSVWRGNFYKCGDALSTPHYLSWNAIDLPSPDFHCPAFFGDLRFE